MARNPGQNGFVFSMDSIFAVSIALILGLAVFFLPASQESKPFLEWAEQQAGDEAAVQWYLGQGSASAPFFSTLEGALQGSPQKSVAACASHFAYPLNTVPVQLDLGAAEKKFCRGAA